MRTRERRVIVSIERDVDTAIKSRTRRGAIHIYIKEEYLYGRDIRGGELQFD